MSDQDYHAARERRQAEEADYARRMGEYLAGILEEADRGKEDAASSIFDASEAGRAKAAKEGDGSRSVAERG
jgi:hypothetical protein